jgi:hypothetical protein
MTDPRKKRAALSEKRDGKAILKPVSATKFRSFTEIGRHLAERFPEGGDFPEPPPRPTKHERPILEF